MAEQQRKSSVDSLTQSTSMPVISSAPAHLTTTASNSIGEHSQGHFSKFEEFPLPAIRKVSVLDDEQQALYDFSVEMDNVNARKKGPQLMSTLAVESMLDRKGSSQSMLDEAEEDENELVEALEELDKEDIEEYTNTTDIKIET